MSELAWYFGAGIGLFFIQGTINIFFIVRVFKKVDASTEGIIALQKDILHLSEKVSEVKNLQDRLTFAEKEIAVLQHVARCHHPETMKV